MTRHNRETITITPTAEGAVLNGIPVRIWDGVAADGQPCKVFVALVGFRDDHVPADLERLLLPIRPRILDPEGP